MTGALGLLAGTSATARALQAGEPKQRVGMPGLAGEMSLAEPDGVFAIQAADSIGVLTLQAAASIEALTPLAAESTGAHTLQTEAAAPRRINKLSSRRHISRDFVILGSHV